MKARFLLLLVLTAASASLNASEDQDPVIIVNGRYSTFAIGNLPGWVVDLAAGESEDLAAAIYPIGEMWSTSEVGLYLRSKSANSSVKTGEEAMKVALESLQKDGNPNLTATKWKDISLPNGRVATIWIFEGGNHGGIDAAAFFPEPEAVNVIGLTSRTKGPFYDAIHRLESVVSSYIPMGGTRLGLDDAGQTLRPPDPRGAFRPL